jgi:hypothetical protein
VCHDELQSGINKEQAVVAVLEGDAHLPQYDGSTCIYSGLSLDRKHHSHPSHLGRHPPKTAPYDLALRCDPDGDVPQIQFNEDGVWHDLAPEGEGRVGLKAGPWFPYLQLFGVDRLSDHRVQPLQAAPPPAAALPTLKWQEGRSGCMRRTSGCMASGSTAHTAASAG